jgi:hypothetical protein
MATVAVQRAKLEKDNQKLQQTQRELETQQTSLSEKISTAAGAARGGKSTRSGGSKWRTPQESLSQRDFRRIGVPNMTR